MQEIEKIIAKSFSGEITSEEKNILSGWLKENYENEKYLAQLKNIWQASNPPFNLDEIDVNSAEETVLQKIDHPISPKISLWNWWQRVAAIVVFPLILTLSYFLVFDKGLSRTDVVYQEVSAPPGTNSRIELTDGSIVWLNSNSKLRYPITFSNDRREVTLSGEAYFEVESDKKNPFIVTTKTLTIMATGTAFNVEAYEFDSIAAVTLIKGKVNVDIKGMTNMDIEPNQRLIYNNIVDKYSTETVSPYKWYAWKDGILMFRDDPLDYVFKRIGLMFNIQIDVKDKEIASHPYRATFEGESLDEILKLMKMTVPIEYVKEDRIIKPNDSYTKGRIEVYKAK